MILALTDTFSFGKYKGQALKSVCEQNPMYIAWVYKNVKSVELSVEVRQLASTIAIWKAEEAAKRYGSAGDWGFPEY